MIFGGTLSQAPVERCCLEVEQEQAGVRLNRLLHARELLQIFTMPSTAEAPRTQFPARVSDK
eukprot:5050351-Amphidinium_carterae.1